MRFHKIEDPACQKEQDMAGSNNTPIFPEIHFRVTIYKYIYLKVFVNLLMDGSTDRPEEHAINSYYDGNKGMWIKLFIGKEQAG